MEKAYLKQLDEFFASQFSDYVKISAIEGYEMPEMLTVSPDGQIARRDSKYMRLIYQKNWEELLARFKEGLADTEYTFDFSFPTFRERVRDRFRKQTFAKFLPEVLKKYDETPRSALAKLTLEEKIAAGIERGSLYPEKNTVMALALVCRMQMGDVNNLFALCGFTLSGESVRDVVFEYLVTQKLFNEEMRDECLAAYRIDTLPIPQTAGANGGADA